MHSLNIHVDLLNDIHISIRIATTSLNDLHEIDLHQLMVLKKDVKALISIILSDEIVSHHHILHFVLKAHDLLFDLLF